MLHKADFFQEQNNQCRRLAAQASNKNDREFWLQMAQRWEGLLVERYSDPSAPEVSANWTEVEGAEAPGGQLNALPDQKPSGIRPNPKAAVSAMPVVSVKAKARIAAIFTVITPSSAMFGAFQGWRDLVGLSIDQE